MVNEEKSTEHATAGAHDTTKNSAHRKSGALRMRLLNALRETDRIVSGEELSSSFSVSRVAVWKQIQTLRENGYMIESTHKGYRLDDRADVLSAADFSDEIPFYHYQSISSTMNAAAASGEEHRRALFVADIQEAGRGRLERRWESAEGGLYATLRLRNRLPLVHAWRYGFVAVLSLRASLNSLYGMDTGVKWPNDLLANGRKLAGVLLEVTSEDALTKELRIGFGLNMNNVPPTPESDSLANILGKPVLRRKILSSFLAEFYRREMLIEGDALLNEWKHCNSTIGRNVEVTTVQRRFYGTAVDLDPSGALVIETEPGVRELVYAGDIR